MSRDLRRPESALAWDFRGYWAKQTTVTVTMSDRCIARTVVGTVQTVAATGAFAVVDGWHLPMSDVLRVDRATVADREDYGARMEEIAAMERENEKRARRRVTA